MNIFYDPDPLIAARMMADKHCVKMILETAQLLSTAHRVLDGQLYIEKKRVAGSIPIRYRKIKRWRLNDERDSRLYAPTHVNHPSAIWCRQSSGNYNFLYQHFIGLLEEYTYRYGKTHKCTEMTGVLQDLPNKILLKTVTQPPPAMDKRYVVSEDCVENYRNYYKYGKAHLLKYTKRDMPEWLS